MADTEETEDSHHGMLGFYVLLTVGGAGVLLGLTPLLLAALHRLNSSGVLRGRVLSNPICARCPAVRDCFQDCGTFCRIKWLTLDARDSMEDFYDAEAQTIRYDRLRKTRRVQPTIIGLTPARVFPTTAPSGFRWKKRWLQRRLRSKAKRKKKNEVRKQKKKDVMESTSEYSTSTTQSRQSQSGSEEEVEAGLDTSPSGPIAHKEARKDHQEAHPNELPKEAVRKGEQPFTNNQSTVSLLLQNIHQSIVSGVSHKAGSTHSNQTTTSPQAVTQPGLLRPETGFGISSKSGSMPDSM